VQGHWACQRCVNDYNNDPIKVFTKRCPCCEYGTLGVHTLWGDIRYWF